MKVSTFCLEFADVNKWLTDFYVSPTQIEMYVELIQSLLCYSGRTSYVICMISATNQLKERSLTTCKHQVAVYKWFGEALPNIPAVTDFR